MNGIVGKNLELMTGTGEWHMKDLLLKESFGGNAGFYRTRSGGKERACSCAATNFFYDAKTGEIACFANVQDVPRDIVSRYAEGTFKVALDAFNTWKTRIVGAYTKRGSSGQALKNIKDSVREYNSRYSF